MPIVAWHILRTGDLYRDPGGDHFANRDPRRTTRRLVAQLEALDTTSRPEHQRRRGH
jgi:hypothetical protein